MVPNGPAGNRPAQDEELPELNECSGPKRVVLSLSNITSRLSTATGGWGKWLLNSASDFVSEIGVEYVGPETLSHRRENVSTGSFTQQSFISLIRFALHAIVHAAAAAFRSGRREE